MSGKLILVTGVTAFIAGHASQQLLERGYRVRGTARGAKYSIFVATVNPALEFVQINNFATGDFTKALEGVDAIFHIGCSFPGRKSPEDTLKCHIRDDELRSSDPANGSREDRRY